MKPFSSCRFRGMQDRICTCINLIGSGEQPVDASRGMPYLCAELCHKQPHESQAGTQLHAFRTNELVPRLLRCTHGRCCSILPHGEAFALHPDAAKCNLSANPQQNIRRVAPKKAVRMRALSHRHAPTPAFAAASRRGCGCRWILTPPAVTPSFSDAWTSHLSSLSRFFSIRCPSSQLQIEVTVSASDRVAILNAACMATRESCSHMRASSMAADAPLDRDDEFPIAHHLSFVTVGPVCDLQLSHDSRSQLRWRCGHQQFLRNA